MEFQYTYTPCHNDQHIRKVLVMVDNMIGCGEEYKWTTQYRLFLNCIIIIAIGIRSIWIISLVTWIEIYLVYNTLIVNFNIGLNHFSVLIREKDYLFIKLY